MPDQNLLSSRAVMGMYYARLEADIGMGWLDGIANMFNSDQPSETYVFLGQTPAMREWVGKRQAKGLRVNSFTISNVHYEDTIEFAIKDMRRDKTGQIEARINEFADQGTIHWSKLCSDLILNAASSVCYDGQFYFDTNHSEGDSGVQSNSISVDISALPTKVHGAAASAPSVEEFQQSMLRGVAQILSFKDDQGQPMNQGAKKFTVVVPVGLYLTATAAVSQMVSAYLAPNLNPNIIAGLSLDVQMDPRSIWTDQFALFRADASTKGLIRQQETEPVLKVKDENSEFAFDNAAVQFGIDAWRGADYGHWQRACLVKLV